jgi:hypothetical protein
MAYQLIQFGSLVFATNDSDISARHYIGSGASYARTFALSGGGAFNAFEGARAPIGPVSISYEAEILLRVPPDPGVTPDTIFDALSNIKALVGTVDQLWRDPPGSLSNQFVYAKLEYIDADWDPEASLILPFRAEFTQLSPYWNGDGHGRNSGTPLTDYKFTLTSSPDTITVQNDGDREATGIVIDVANPALAAAITVIEIESADGGFHFTWTGSLAAGETLSIDTRDRSVLKGSADAYSGFAYGANHDIAYWASLPGGPATDIDVTITGGSIGSIDPTIQVSFYDAWL